MPLAKWHPFSSGFNVNPDSKVHGANMGPIWGRQDPGGLHVGPMDFPIWEIKTDGEWIVHSNFS